MEVLTPVGPEKEVSRGNPQPPACPLPLVTSVCPSRILLSFTCTYCFWKQEVVVTLGNRYMSIHRWELSTGLSPGHLGHPKCKQSHSKEQSCKRKPKENP